MARASKKNTIVVEPRLLNIKAAALYLSTTIWYMRTLIWERKIPFLKLGNAYGFDRQDLDAFITSQKTAARA
jgi:excisionase family DNA binding protein